VLVALVNADRDVLAFSPSGLVESRSGGVGGGPPALLLLRRYVLLLLRHRRREACTLLLLLLLLLLRLEAAQVGRGAEHQRQDGHRHEGKEGVEALHWCGTLLPQRRSRSGLVCLGLAPCGWVVGAKGKKGKDGEVRVCTWRETKEVP